MSSSWEILLHSSLTTTAYVDKKNTNPETQNALSTTTSMDFLVA